MHRLRFREAALLVALFLASLAAAAAAAPNPLEPPDTSSPRATLQSFLATADAIYMRFADILKEYGASGRLYLTAEEHKAQAEESENARNATQFLDTSRILPVLRESVAIERIIQLKEVLDRIALPPFAEIPDREEMARSSSKRWRIPHTEIDIVQIEEGPQAGQYLISAETVERLPEFYDRVKHLPYKPGPQQDLSDAYRLIGGRRVATIFDAFSSSPIGLSYIIPPRWMLNLPDWTRVRLAGVAVWQWFALSLGLAGGAAIIHLSHRLGHRLARADREDGALGWEALLTPLSIALVMGFLVPSLCTALRIVGIPRLIIAYAQTTILYLTAAYLALLCGNILGDMLARSERLSASSLDSQLIRLGSRFAGVVVAIGFLIRGADELGFPAYSVVAGLGVGGLAVALAARDSLANFLGSVLIMLEKPFRVGHVIRVAGSEGTVLDVGFRSTRIRTPDNSLISIPNNAVVNATVENLSLRPTRRQRFVVQIAYDTPRDKVEAFLAAIKQFIAEHPATDKSTYHVYFNNLSESSLDILIIFNLSVADYAGELKERQDVLFGVMDLAEQNGVAFAFPPRATSEEPGAKAENSHPELSPAQSG